MRLPRGRCAWLVAEWHRSAVSQTKLFVSSEVPIYQIFSDDPHGKKGEISDHMRSVMDDLVCDLREHHLREHVD